MQKNITILLLCLLINNCSVIAGESESGSVTGKNSKKSESNKTELTLSERRFSGAIDLCWAGLFAYLSYDAYKSMKISKDNWAHMRSEFGLPFITLFGLGGKKQVYAHGLISAFLAFTCLNSAMDAYKALISSEKMYKK